MPIGATIGAAAITAGGAVASSSAQKKAAGKASDSAAASSAANTALARENYANNAQRLDPYAASGMRAGGVLNDMLLGPRMVGDPRAGSGVNGALSAIDIPPPSDYPGFPYANHMKTGQYGAPQPVGDEAWSNGALNAMGLGSRGNSPATLQAHLSGQLEGPLSPQMMSAYESYRAGNPMQAAAPNAVSGQNAWDQFRNSTNYQFRLGEGNKAFAQGAFAKGIGESGAAIKGAINYNQQFAANELGNFQDRLAQQQQMGMGAASALAGVGQNMVSNVTASNNAAAGAAGNAALIGGAANGQMWGSIAGALGTAASSFAPRTATPAPTTQPYMGVLGGGYYG